MQNLKTKLDKVNQETTKRLPLPYVRILKLLVQKTGKFFRFCCFTSYTRHTLLFAKITFMKKMFPSIAKRKTVLLTASRETSLVPHVWKKIWIQRMKHAHPPAFLCIFINIVPFVVWKLEEDYENIPWNGEYFIKHSHQIQNLRAKKDQLKVSIPVSLATICVHSFVWVNSCEHHNWFLNTKA